MSEVVMPQMGESIAEGTIVRWIKKVGDRVDRDEPLFEISTDKVDAEIPSPTAGVLVEIRAKEGETVPVNSVVAVIGEAGAQVAAPASAGCPRPPPCAAAPPPAARLRAAAPLRRRSRPGLLRSPRSASGACRPRRRCADDSRRQKSSPLVRKIAKEHNVDLAQVPGIGPRRPRDQGRHPRLSRQGRAPGVPGARCGGHCGSPPPAAPRARLQAGRPRRGRADVGDAQEDRRAHDHEPAHVGARALGVRGRLLARREDPRREEGRVRAPGPEAHLHVVPDEGHRRRAQGGARSSTARSTATRSSTRRTSTSASPWRSTGA